MTTSRLLQSLRQLGIQVKLNGEELSVSPRERITPELKSEITTRKAELIRYFRKAQPGLPASAYAPLPAGHHAPLSFSQDRLWQLHKLEGLSAAHNLTILVPLSGAFIRPAMDAAVRHILFHHTCLRTGFREVAGSPTQTVAHEITPVIREVALDVAECDEEGAIRAIGMRQTDRPFRPEQCPLMRMTLIRANRDRHVLAITVHKLIADIESLGILGSELRSVYAAHQAGSEPPHSPAPHIQFARYSSWQQEQSKGDAGQADLTYWKEKLRAPTCQFKVPRRWPEMKSDLGAGTESFCLDEPLSKSVSSLASEENTTADIVLLALLQALLLRYATTDDVVAAMSVSARTLPELTSATGPFESVLLVRTRGQGRLSFREFLHAVHENVGEALLHQAASLQQIAGAVQRTALPIPLFDVALVPFNLPAGVLLPTSAGRATTALSLVTQQAADGKIHAAFEYDRGKFDRETIVRLREHFTRLTREALRRPGDSTATLALGDDVEPTRRRIDWFQTLPEGCSALTELVTGLNRFAGDKPAIIDDDGALRYDQLENRSNRLAARLRNLFGYGEVRIGVYSNRRVDFAVAMLAIFKAGMVCVPLDPAWLESELAQVRIDARLDAVVMRGEPANRNWTGASVVALEDTDTHYSPTPPRISQQRGAIAFVFHVKDPAGGQVGAQVSLLAVSMAISRLTAATELGPSDHVLDLTPAGTARSWIYTLAFLTCGCTITATDTLALEPTRVRNALDNQGITCCVQLPSEWNALLDVSGDRKWPGLKMIGTGEAITADLATRLLRKGAALWNAYGVTEEAAVSALYRTNVGENYIACGSVESSPWIYVLDDLLEPVPAGVAGEICIGSTGEPHGYWQRPALTRERYVKVRFLSDCYLFRTGDRGRWHPNGTLEYLGRTDDQVHVMGRRAFLGDVETLLCRQDKVADAAVVKASPQSLTAYVCAHRGTEIAAAEIRAGLKGLLPEFLIPSDYVPIRMVPRTREGAIDRPFLPVAPARPIAPVTPRTHAERLLTTIWEDTLGCKGFGVDDSFFELGGNSLKAVELTTRLEPVFGKQAMSLVFDAPTVAKMAAAIADSAKRTSPSLLVSIQPNGERLPVFGAPGLYGDPAVFCALAEELGDDQPFYGLTAAGFERQPLDDVGEIAARCLTEVKSRQPHGPYSLIGQCTGGYIAVEMAHRLALAGHSIKMLALIDCWPPEWPAPLERWLCGNAVATALHRAGRNYRPPRLQIPMVLLLADILTIPGNDPREWWSRHTTDRVHVLRLPGRDAGEMLRQPAVKAMAEKVRSFLAAA